MLLKMPPTKDKELIKETKEDDVLEELRIKGRNFYRRYQDVKEESR